MNDGVYVTITVVHVREIAEHVRGMTVHMLRTQWRIKEEWRSMKDERWCICYEHSGACERNNGA